MLTPICIPPRKKMYKTTYKNVQKRTQKYIKMHEYIYIYIYDCIENINLYIYIYIYLQKSIKLIYENVPPRKHIHLHPFSLWDPAAFFPEVPRGPGPSNREVWVCF